MVRLEGLSLNPAKSKTPKCPRRLTWKIPERAKKTRFHLWGDPTKIRGRRSARSWPTRRVLFDGLGSRARFPHPPPRRAPKPLRREKCLVLMRKLESKPSQLFGTIWGEDLITSQGSLTRVPAISDSQTLRFRSKWRRVCWVILARQ